MTSLTRFGIIIPKNNSSVQIITMTGLCSLWRLVNLITLLKLFLWPSQVERDHQFFLRNIIRMLVSRKLFLRKYWYAWLLTGLLSLQIEYPKYKGDVTLLLLYNQINWREVFVHRRSRCLKLLYFNKNLVYIYTYSFGSIWWHVIYQLLIFAGNKYNFFHAGHFGYVRPFIVVAFHLG